MISKPSKLSQLATLEGATVGVSDWILVDQHRIDQFAAATDDFQWIHVDSMRAARQMPEGRTIAHGYLTLALIPAFVREALPIQDAETVINYGIERVRFTQPVVVGSRLRARMRLPKIVRRGRDGTELRVTISALIESDQKGDPVCVADVVFLYRGKAATAAEDRPATKERPAPDEPWVGFP
jgi:acyl dehydratase